MDPLLDLIRLLRPQATLWGGLDANGRWALQFHKRDDVLFCWVETGRCSLIRKGAAPVVLQPNDFVLIRTTTAFTLASEPNAPAVDSEAPDAPRREGRFVLGSGEEAPATLHAGRFVFDAANADLVMDLLPPIVHVAAADRGSARLRSLLAMAQLESSEPLPGAAFVVPRLIELILVEILRGVALRPDRPRTELLAGLTDPTTARALAAMHKDVAHGWTVADLAALSGASRSKFAARFRAIVGTGPIDYLLRWRIAIAKDALRLGTASIGEIGRSIGFQSTSAFSTAFTRGTGISPGRFRAQTTNDTLSLENAN